MNVGIYFNIVPKGNDKLSLYFENKNSTLKLHKNKDSDNAQWEVKWLGAENGKYGFRYITFIVYPGFSSVRLIFFSPFLNF